MSEPLVGKRFVDERIDLTHQAAHYCVFDGCVLILSEQVEAAHLLNCTFRECQLVGFGWIALWRGAPGEDSG